MTPPHHLELTHAPIDHRTVVESVRTNLAGAVVLFLGTVRELTEGKHTTALEYEAYPEMAMKQLGMLVDQAATRWPIQKAAIVHRLGHLDLGEVAVAVAVSTPHRREAFESGQWIMDQIKEVVPIWKKENWADGTTEWVHPGSS
ncbi:MAG: molybdenum cofactor biosynthesis protein MoaE [Planctomycetota bacterium]|nr:MAG: molybdenum cofactor biosynthesis protein MoaE [Planctomycetota bacterium]